MKIRFTLFLTISLLLTLTIIAAAQTEPPQRGTKTPVINQRQDRQKTRIKRGVKSGELTKQETKTLSQDVKDIQAAKTEAKADGTVTRQERKEIQQQQNQTSRKIYRKKHNSRSRN
ncbi:MAG TPA: hypothetical protein VEF04_17760 [Blastocatellia bacterium]|nr:hypothetical protein [Blastocatellia bacterium]